MAASSVSRYVIAASRLVRHISCDGCRPEQTFGRRGEPKMLQRLSAESWTQRVLAGLPLGIPGIGLLIDGAVQQAPQSGRHSINGSLLVMNRAANANALPHANTFRSEDAKPGEEACQLRPSRVLCRDIFPTFPAQDPSWQERTKSKKVWY